MLKKIVVTFLFLIFLFLSILVFNALTMPLGITTYPESRDDIVDRINKIDTHTVASRIAESIEFPTVSYDDGPVDPGAFIALHEWLNNTYPSAHLVLERELINDLSLVYKWKGTSDCNPIGFVTHLDVVPVESGTEDEWTYPPFKGVVSDGFVWGRGAYDTKNTIIYFLEAVENLANRGFTPRCDVYLLAGHDEEAGGQNGAKETASLLRSRNIHFSWLIDEGGSFSANLDGSTAPMVANIGVGQRGFANIKLTVRAKGGSTARGTEETAITKLSRAILTIRENPMPGRLDGVPEEDLIARARGGLFYHKLIAANTWLLRPVAETILESKGQVNYLRSTAAATIISGGDKFNLLPQQASAIIGVRLHPRDTSEDVMKWLKDIVQAEDIKFELISFSDPPLPVDPNNNKDFNFVSNSIAAVYGSIRIVPSFLTSATDGRYYRDLTDSLFNFDADMFLPDNKNSGGHGTDERITTSHLAEAVVLYEVLIETH